MTTSITSPNPTSRLRSLSLPLLLQLDAAVTGANGAAYLLGASRLDEVLGIEASTLRATGAFLVAYAVVVAAIGLRRPVPRPAALAVVATNVLWAAGSLVVAATDAATTTATGTVWTVMQAVVVAAFAALQWDALRRRSHTEVSRSASRPIEHGGLLRRSRTTPAPDGRPLRARPER